jgi:hypothetical protein
MDGGSAYTSARKTRPFVDRDPASGRFFCNGLAVQLQRRR